MFTDEQREQARAYYHATKEKRLKAKQRYREKNRDILAEKQRQYDQTHNTHIAKRRRHKLYGVTPDQIDIMLLDQGNQCAICGISFDLVNYHVDHNHTTGVVRGLLCNDCNLGLGRFKDTPAILIKAVSYLQQFS